MTDSEIKYGWLVFPLYEPRATDPQHHSLASKSSTQEWANPANTATGALDDTDNATGKDEFISMRPQQKTFFEM
jgi:hypothetical protein